MSSNNGSGTSNFKVFHIDARGQRILLPVWVVQQQLPQQLQVQQLDSGDARVMGVVEEEDLLCHLQGNGSREHDKNMNCLQHLGQAITAEIICITARYNLIDQRLGFGQFHS